MAIRTNIERSKIKSMLELSKEVMLDGALENGAVVAANATKNYYPPTAKHYFYVCRETLLVHALPLT